VYAEAFLHAVIRFQHVLMARADDEEIAPLLPLHLGPALEELDAELRHEDVLGQREEAAASAGGDRRGGFRVRRVGLDHGDALYTRALEEISGGAAHNGAADDCYVVGTR
jgi:hypothetical protein